MPEKVVCAGGVLVREQKLLLARRSDDREFHPGVWDVVGLALAAEPRSAARDRLEVQPHGDRALPRRQAVRPFEWSDARVYCSELVWKTYERGLGIEIGRLAKLPDFKLDDPLVHAKLRERYGGSVPLDEPVIARSASFDSALLGTVAER